MTFNAVYVLAAATICVVVSGCSSVNACQTPECAADARISAEIAGRLGAIPSLATNNISVDTVNGVVYLYGPVDSPIERNLAVSAAKVSGVKKVYDDLNLRAN